MECEKKKTTRELRVLNCPTRVCDDAAKNFTTAEFLKQPNVSFYGKITNFKSLLPRHSMYNYPLMEQKRMILYKEFVTLPITSVSCLFFIKLERGCLESKITSLLGSD